MGPEPVAVITVIEVVAWSSRLAVKLSTPVSYPGIVGSQPAVIPTNSGAHAF